MKTLLLTFLLVCLTCGLYAQTTCQTPSSLYTQNITHQSALAYWFSGTAASQYQVQWRVAGAATWTVPASLTTTQYSFSGLTNNTTYEWRVRSVCVPGDTSAFAATQVFRTVCSALYSTYVNSINYNGASLSWSASVYNAPTELQWRPVNTSTWNSVDGLITSTYSLTGLTMGTLYEWQARTVCSASATSNFLAGPVFRPECPMPTALNASGISYNRARLNWNSSQSNLPHEVQWRPQGATTWNSLTTTSGNTNLIDLTNNTRYEWRVRAVCSALVQSDYSAVQSFGTNCPAPTLNAGSVDASSILLTWSSTEPLASFTLHWKPSNQTNWNTLANLELGIYRLRNLTVDTNYDWQVQAVCTPAARSSFVSGSSFLTRCNAAPIGYASELKGTAATIRWTGDEDNVRYDLRWRSVGGANWTVVPGLTNTVHTLTGLTNGLIYEWQLQRVCSLSSTTPTSGYGSSQSVQLTCANPNSLQVNTTRATGAVLSWSGPTSSYEVQYRPTGFPDWTTVQANETTVALGNLTPGLTYEWRVRLLCGDGITSAYASGSSFLLPCNAPWSIYGFALTRTSARLSWNSSGIGRYDLEWRLAGQANWTIIGDISGNNWILENLAPGNTYETRIRARCSATVWSGYSSSSTFNTNCKEPTGLFIKSTTFTLINLNWTADDPTVTYSVRFRERNVGNWGEDTGLTKSPVTKAGMTVGREYEWQVKTICGNGLESGYVSGPVFRAECPAVTTLWISDITDATAKLNWNSIVYEGVRYTVQWRQQGASVWNSVPNLTESTLLLTGLTNQTSYQFQVLTNCPTNDTPNPVASTYAASWQTHCGVSISTETTDVTANSARLRWSSYNRPDITQFDLQWRLTTTPAQDWITVSDLTSNGYLLTDLQTGSSYEWRIRYRCSPGIYSGYQNTNTFATGCSAPAVLRSSVKPTTAELSWNYSSSDNGIYELRWRPTTTTEWTTVPNLVSTTYSLSGLIHSTGYVWEVRTLCTNGQYLSSQGSSFKTLSDCLINLTNTTVDVGETTAYLSWTPSVAAPSYTVFWRASTATSWQQITGITSTSLVLSGLMPRTTYHYYVQPNCLAASPALQPGYVGGSTFTTRCTLPQGFYTSLEDLQTTTARIRFVRSMYAAPGSVDFQWRVAGATDWQAIRTANDAVTLTGLTDQTAYEYQVQAICPNTTVPATSEQYQFTTFCPNSGLYNTPIARTGPTSAQLWWGTGITGRTHELQWRQSPTRPGGTETWTTISNVTSETYLLGGLTSNTLHEWRVRSICGNTGSAFSAVMPFLTGCTEPTSLMLMGKTAATATISWANELPGSLFDVTYRPIGTSNWVFILGVQPPFSLTGLTNQTTYQWQVRRNCGTNQGSNWVDGTPFKAECQWPSTMNPYPTRLVGATSVTLTVASLPGVQYAARYRASGSPAWQQSASMNTVPFAITGLKGNTVYEVDLQLVCEAGVRSDYWVFMPTRTFPDCSSLYTVQPGSWADPRVWSCNRLPTSADSVRLLHSVQVPGLFSGAAKSFRFELGGTLKFGVQAGVKTGE